MKKSLSHRVSLLEKEVAALRRSHTQNGAKKSKHPAWVADLGFAENDPVFDEAVRLTQAWRRKAR